MPDPGSFEDFGPAAQPPVPTIGSVEPKDGLSSRSRCLMDSRVVFDGKRQVRAEGRVLRLIVNELLLRRERNIFKMLLLQPTGIKTISLGKNRAHFSEAGRDFHAAPILHHADWRKFSRTAPMLRFTGK